MLQLSRQDYDHLESLNELTYNTSGLESIMAGKAYAEREMRDCILAFLGRRMGEGRGRRAQCMEHTESRVRP